MRVLGLRPQILLLLGGLLVVAFAPLQLTLATYTRVTLRQLDDEQARALGHTLANQVLQSAPLMTPAELVRELERGAAESWLVAARVTSPGAESAQFGDGAVLRALHDASREGLPRMLRVEERRLWVLEATRPGRAAWLAIDAERSGARGRSLIGMFGLYAFLIAVAWLTLAYFALTRLIMNPLEALSQAAENVTLGKRRLAPPVSS